MKSIKLLLGLLGIGIIMIHSGCKNYEEPLTDQQVAAKQLSGIWSNAQIVSSPVPGATASLSDLVLSFTVTNNSEPSTFSATGASRYFSTGNNWMWVDKTTTNAIVLNGSTPVSEIFIDEITTTNLTISFMLSGPVGGRVSGIGEYTVRLTKQ